MNKLHKNVVAMITCISLVLFSVSVQSQEYNYLSTEEILQQSASQPVVEPAISFTSEDKQCLTDNIYFEARGEGFRGMLAVAYVTVNRVFNDLYPDTICEVVKQKYKKTCQFSWVCEPKRIIDRTNELYREAVEVANTVLYSYHPSKDPTRGATMFHSKDVEPIWMNTYKRTVQIKNHLFYRQPSLRSNR